MTIAALSFSADAKELALKPIERVIVKVNKIAQDPLSARFVNLTDNGNQDNEFETQIIENAITKTGTLLALGFGEAGTEIIVSNVTKAGGELFLFFLFSIIPIQKRIDPISSGKKIYAIFGFTNIHNFTIVTEQL